MGVWTWSGGITAQWLSLGECRATLEGLRMEHGSLKAHLENEKQKATETSPVGHTAEGREVQEMSRVARAEKEQLELSCTELKQELVKAYSEVKHVSSLLAKVRRGVPLSPCWLTLLSPSPP